MTEYKGLYNLKELRCNTEILEEIKDFPPASNLRLLRIDGQPPTELQAYVENQSYTLTTTFWIAFGIGYALSGVLKN
jgi:hypothetical protein